jgi:hypothetical protein
MGKIIRGGEAWSQVKLSTRRAGGGGACSVEFTAYLTCLDKTQANEEECKTLREAVALKGWYYRRPTRVNPVLKLKNDDVARQARGAP